GIAQGMLVNNHPLGQPLSPGSSDKVCSEDLQYRRAHHPAYPGRKQGGQGDRGKDEMPPGARPGNRKYFEFYAKGQQQEHSQNKNGESLADHGKDYSQIIPYCLTPGSGKHAQWYGNYKRE